MSLPPLTSQHREILFQFRHDVGRNIAALRQGQGLSIEECAMRAGLSAWTWINYEYGRKDLSFEILIRLAYLFKTTPQAVLGMPIPHDNGR